MAYITSALYKEAINNESRTTFISGELRTVNGEVIQIKNDDLVTGGFYITNQCVNGDAFEYGSVFAAELGITLKSEIDRYTLYDAKITPFFNILLRDGTYEQIPLGVFSVNDPERVGRNISMKAYDGMINLDKELLETIEGTAYDLLLYISLHCDVQLAQSRSEIKNLFNSGILLSVNPSLISTHRELLSYICKVTCTFACFDRSGKLKLCEFQNNVSKEIPERARVSSRFSDFETFYSEVTASFISNDSYKSYTYVEEGTGLSYDLGEVPIVKGLDQTNQNTLISIFSKLKLIRYVPCDISFSGDPSIDLGDMIRNVDRKGNVYDSIVTFYKWTYRGNHSLKSAGKNPRLSKAKSQSEKAFESLQQDMTTKDIAVYTYTNASNISFSGGNRDNVTNMSSIAMISFAAKKAATCVVTVTIPLEMSEDSDVEFHQLFDGLEMASGLVAQRCHKGKSTITFVNYFTTKADTIHRYSIVGITKGVDENQPGTLEILPYAIRCVIFGQGLSTTVVWDGTIIVSDEIPLFDVAKNVIESIRFSDQVSSKKNNYNPNSISDVVGVFTIETEVIDVVGFDDLVELGG